MKPIIYTYTGRYFDISNPRVEDINALDIAHALSHICRFTGHSRNFYSVAQHCLIMSTLVRPEIALEALLHDAAEAYVGDVSSPLKHLIKDVYKPIESKIQAVIREKFNLRNDCEEEIKAADLKLLLTEKNQVLFCKDEWLNGVTPFDCTIRQNISPIKVHELFSERLSTLIANRILNGENHETKKNN